MNKNKTHTKASPGFYKFFSNVGTFFEVLIVCAVIHISDWNLIHLLWLIPSLIFVEIGCFASRDMYYEYEKEPL